MATLISMYLKHGGRTKATSSMKTRRRNLSGDLSSTTGRNTRSKTLENGRDNSLPIPIDLVFEIFSRLPLKSIARCRCVSKTWASVLRRQDLTELYLSRSRTLPNLLIAYQKGSDLFFYSAPQPQNRDENNSSPVVATYHMNMSFDAYFRNGAFKISELDHGLLDLTNEWFVEGRKCSAPVLCNPSTGQSLPFPRVKTKRVKARSLFGYDPIDKQVKVLSMTGSHGSSNLVAEEYQVMTLGMSRRRMIDCGRLLHYYPHLKGKCINGVLYYTAIEKSTDTYMLVCFHVRSEKFSFVKVENFLIQGTMINYNGKLGLLVSGCSVYLLESSTSVNLWVLEDSEKQEWSEHTYVLPALWKDIVGSEVLVFVGMTRTNEIVMKSIADPPSPLYLFYFDAERNTVARVAIQGMDVSQYDRVHIFLDHVENVKLL